MKNIFLLLCSIGIFQVLLAQKEKDTTFFIAQHKWEFHLNGTSALSNLIGNTSLSNENLTPADYPLLFKHINNSKRTALRFGFGGQFTLNNRLRNNQTLLANYDNRLNVKLGYEYARKVLSKRWMFLAGMDVVGQYRSIRTSTATNIDVVTLAQNGYSLGGGPFAGFQFALHPRVHLGCETGIYGIFTVINERKTFQQFPNTNENTITNTTRISAPIPRWLYLIARF